MDAKEIISFLSSKGLTQQRIADRLSVSQVKIHRIATGHTKRVFFDDQRALERLYVEVAGQVLDLGAAVHS